jgi:biopolymer transport protein ExbD
MFDVPTPRRPMPDINLSALMDIAFILVIFIVLGATFQRVRVVDVELPTADAKADPNDEGLVVTVPREGPVRFGTRPVSDADLPAALLEARKEHEAILLLADREAAVQRAVELLVLAQNQGFATVAIATQTGGR